MKGIRIKKIDSLLFTSFIPPFIVTFAIAVFVLVMQTLWLYIDDIAGKGLGLFLIVELLAYKSVALFPLALPLGILISSVMVLGNMAERYELSSLKSAGVPLLRIMRPLMFFAVFCGVFSYYCSNTLMPAANLKFGSRMYDIQQQKPALQLEAGVFNDDFQGFAIRIGEKEDDERTIHDVLMYDHNNISRGQFTQVVAKDGEMYSSPDGRYFIMHLKDGYQYIETKANSFSATDDSYPFIRTHFKEWFKVFDLSEFELNRTNEELFKSNKSMMSIKELKIAIDSMALKLLKRQVTYSNTVARNFTLQQIDSLIFELDKDKRDEVVDEYAEEYEDPPEDAVPAAEDSAAIAAGADTSRRLRAIDPPSKENDEKFIGAIDVARKNKEIAKEDPRLAIYRKLNSDLSDVEVDGPFIENFKELERGRMYNRALNSARSIYSQAESAARVLEKDKEDRVKYIYEMDTKYSLAVVCLIFLFIGAPMGAIVRKGGFGYPILIAIIFFMLFVVLTIFCRKIAETFVLPAWLCAWLPCIILGPVGFVLTRKAMNDSQVLSFNKLTQWFRKMFRKTNTTKILDANEA